MNLDTKIKNLTDKQKLNFLDELLANDDNVKEKLINHFALEEKISKIYKEKDLNSVAEEIFEVFNGVDLELYIEGMGCNHSGYYGGYYEEDISNELCEDLFIEIEKEIKKYLDQNDFYQVLFVLVASYKAIELGPSIDDNFGLIYDYEEILHEYHSYLISKYSDKLYKIELCFEDKIKLINFLLDNTSSNEELKRFEIVFDIFIKTEDIANFVTSRILEFHIDIQLKILNLLGDDEKYIQSAKKFYKEDNGVSKKLLEKLNKLSLYKEYENIAKECFEKYPQFFIKDVFEVITYDKSPEFYLQLLKYKVLNERDLKNYIAYKKYINENELKKLQDEICNKHDQNYCIKILEYEKKFETILELAKNYRHDLGKYINPIKKYFPKECLEIIIQECNSLMTSFKRNRDTYKNICDLLNIMIDVDIVKDQIELYIKTTLINRKPNLPALKDELMKAGLIQNIINCINKHQKSLEQEYFI